MRANPDVYLQESSLEAVFGRCIRPPSGVTDYVPTLGYAQSGRAQTARIDPVTGCAHAQPVMVPHSNLLAATVDAATTWPQVRWAWDSPTDNCDIWDTGTLNDAFEGMRVIGFAADITTYGDTANAEETASLDLSYNPALYELPYMQGVVVTWQQSIRRITMGTVAAGAAGPDVYADVSVRLGTGDPLTDEPPVIRVRHRFSGTVEVAAYDYATEEYITIRVLAQSSKGAPGSITANWNGGPTYSQVASVVEFRYLNETLQIFLDYSSVPVVLDLSGGALAYGSETHAPGGDQGNTAQVEGSLGGSIVVAPKGLPVISAVQASFRGFRAGQVVAHPIKWRTTAELNGGPVNTGVGPLGASDVYFRLHGGAAQGYRLLDVDDPRRVLDVDSAAEVKCVWSDLWRGDPTGTPEYTQIGTVTTTATNIAGSSVEYKVAMSHPAVKRYNGVDYADYTQIISRVATKVSRVEAAVLADPPALLHRPKQLTQTMWLDIANLTVRTDLNFTLDNWGAVANAVNAGREGHRAINLVMGYPWAAETGLGTWATLPDVTLPGRALASDWQVFRGVAGKYVYHRARAGAATVRLECHDRMVQLAEDKIADPPDMDGWNHYYAVAWCAWHAGIHSNDLAFLANVPADPYDGAANDYFLPLGTGMHPWTPKNRVVGCLELLAQIQQATGYMLYFDTWGRLRYEPWELPTPQPQIAGNTFTLAPQSALAGPGSRLSELLEVTTTSDMADVRNIVQLIGIDAFGAGSWAPIVVKLQDDASIGHSSTLNVNTGEYEHTVSHSEGVFNYVGWKRPLIWVGSRFAELSYAYQVAKRLYAFLSVPGYSCDFTTWLRPDVFPGATVYVLEDRARTDVTGDDGLGPPLPFFVTAVSHEIGIDGGRVAPRSRISGRYLFGR